MTGYFPSPIPSSTDGECLRSTHPLPATMFVGPQSCAIKQRVWARQAAGLIHEVSLALVHSWATVSFTRRV